MKTIATSVLLAAFVVSGCGKGKKGDGDSKGEPDGEEGGTDGGSSPGRVLIGTLPGDADVDMAVAFTVTGGEITASGASKKAVSGGQISLDLPSGSSLQGETDPEKLTSQVLVVFKDDADPLETFDSMKFVAAPTEGNDSLLNLPTEKAKSDTIDLGTIAADADSNGYVASTKVNSDVVDVPQDSLTELAKADDSLRMARNAFANTNDATGESLKLSLAFYWSASVRTAINAVIAPEGLTYDGWGPDIHTNRADMSLNSLCLAPEGERKKMKIRIPEPGVIRSTVDPVTYATEFNSKDATESAASSTGRRNCGFNGGEGYIAEGYADGKFDGQVFMNFGTVDAFKAAIPKGTWTVDIDDKVVGKFDLGVADPVDQTDQKPKVFIPALKVHVDETTKKISKVEARFHLYDRASDSYTEVKDYFAMKQLVKSVQFFVDMTDQGAQSQFISTPGDKGGVFPAAGEPFVLDVSATGEDWRIDATWGSRCAKDPDGFKRADSISVQYEMAGNHYNFNFRQPESQVDQTAVCP